MNRSTGAPPAIAPLTASRVACTICSYCLLPPPFTGTVKLSRCGTCKRAAYCSARCQKADWTLVHKRLCKKLVQLNDFDKNLEVKGKLSRTEYAWIDYRRREIFTEPSKDDPYGIYPGRYVQEQPKCGACFRNPFMGPEFRPLTICTRCTLAWHCTTEACTEEFKEIHIRSECEALVDCAAVERMTIDYALSRGDQRQLMIPTHEAARSYFRLSSVKNWSQYCRRHFTDFDFAISVIAGEPALSRMNPLAKKAAAMMTKESASLPLTIVAALENSIPDLATRRELCVHIVGAAQREGLGKGMLEEVLHLLPSCRSLTISYIGPEAIVIRGEKPNVACQYCQAVGTRRQSTYYPGTYHDYIKSGENTKPADLIICFNTGMAEMEEESWAETLRVILDLKVPAAFTAYSESESALEKTLLEKLDAKFVLKPERNQWKGVIPIRNTWPKEETTREFEEWSYINYWWYIIQGRK